MRSPVYLQYLLDLGFLMAVIFGPLIFVIWYWSDRKLTTREWALLTGLMLIAALFMRVVVMAVLAGLVLIAIAIAWMWHRAILADLRYRRGFARTHLFPGDETEITWTIANEKPLPISWLRWREPIPVRPFSSAEDGIEFDGVKIRDIFDGHIQGLDEVTTLRGYETLVRNSKVRALRRGYYRFGPARWQATDALGLYTAEGAADDASALTVYPRISRSDRFQIQVRALLGEVRRRHSLVEDPIWYRGDRDYRPGDPMRAIDWKATARTSSLQVKVFEPTVHPKLMLLVNLHAFEHIAQGWITQYMEERHQHGGLGCHLGPGGWI